MGSPSGEPAAGVMGTLSRCAEWAVEWSGLKAEGGQGGHLVLELVLLLAVLYLLLQKSSRRKSGKGGGGAAPLTEEEVDELCAEWRPEPLAPPIAGGLEAGPKTRVISGPPAAHVVADGKRVLNLVSTNFLGFAGDKSVNEACKKTIVKYGCGSAGPRGFYGTIDVHLELEKRIAAFFGVDEAIIYSYGVATMTSLIPAYAKRGDLIVCDAGINYALQSGVILSRSTVHYFRHNDVADLESLLSRLSEEDRRSGKKLRRRFVVVEGIYNNYGDIAALDRIVPLCRRYKFRLMVDESMSVGVLGETGRGCFEHFGIKQTNVEILTAAMGHSLGSVGGFCAGDKEMIAHQRLGGNGYVFSASLPPFLATASIKAIDLLEAKSPLLLPRLRSNAAELRRRLRQLPQVDVEGDAISPVIHVRLKPSLSLSRGQAEAILNSVVNHAFKHNVLLTTAKYSALERNPPPPSIRIAVTTNHTQSDLASAAAVIKEAGAKYCR